MFGAEECNQVIQEYLQNTALLKQTFEHLGYAVYGGEHAPYIWVHFPKETSWNTFEYLLEQFHLITIPGSGFGTAGEEFIRVSAFAAKEEVQEAVNRLHSEWSH